MNDRLPAGWIAPVAWGALAFASVGFAFIALFGPEFFFSPGRVTIPITPVASIDEPVPLVTGSAQIGTAPRQLAPEQPIPPGIGVQPQDDRRIAELIDERFIPLEKLLGAVQKRAINNDLTNNALEDRLDQAMDLITDLKSRVDLLEKQPRAPGITNRPAGIRSGESPGIGQTIAPLSAGPAEITNARSSGLRGVREIPLPLRVKADRADPSGDGPSPAMVDQIDLVAVQIPESNAEIVTASLPVDDEAIAPSESLEELPKIVSEAGPETAAVTDPEPAGNPQVKEQKSARKFVYRPLPRPDPNKTWRKANVKAPPRVRPATAASERFRSTVSAALSKPPERAPVRQTEAKPADAAASVNVTPDPIITGSTGANDGPVISQTLFAIDLGTYRTMAALDTGWQKAKQDHAGLLGELNALANVDDGQNGVELRLLAGPFRNAADAASYCARLVSQGRNCQPSLYIGQPR